MVSAVNSAGGHAELTVYENTEHDSWTRTYDDPAFFDWLRGQRRERRDASGGRAAGLPGLAERQVHLTSLAALSECCRAG